MRLLSRITLVLFVSAIGASLFAASDEDTAADAVADTVVDKAVQDSLRLAALDNGVDTIDVSKYTEEMQQYYEVVKEKCTQCHKLSRVINSKFALPDEWKRYVKRMRRKPGSKIKKKDAKRIYKFLVYDSEQRKADIIKEKLAAAKKDEAQDK